MMRFGLGRRRGRSRATLGRTRFGVGDYQESERQVRILGDVTGEALDPSFEASGPQPKREKGSLSQSDLGHVLRRYGV